MRRRRGGWRRSERLLWQSSEGSQGLAWLLRALSPCQPPPEMGCAGGAARAAAGARHLCVRRDRGGVRPGATGPRGMLGLSVLWLSSGFQAWQPLTGGTEQDPHSPAPWGCPGQLGTAVLCKVLLSGGSAIPSLALCIHVMGSVDLLMFKSSS